MKKDECEKAIRNLCHTWRDAEGLSDTPPEKLSYYDFMDWMKREGYGHYLEFRCTMGVNYMVEMWFDQEFKQTWSR